MPSNRSKNAAKKPSKGRLSKQAQSKQPALALTDVERDIAGVVLAVIAVAMFISVVVPSGAVVTSAVGHALKVSFGAGAILVPVALFLFSTTFFVGKDGPFSGHVAAGLALIVLAVLAMLSLNQPGIGDAPELALSAYIVEDAGGYVGGFVALWMAKLVGVIVGNVLLVGLIAAGVVICGFSISDAVSRVGERVNDAREDVAARRQERLAERAKSRQLAATQRASERASKAAAKALQSAQPSLFDETGEGKTAFLGDRKTTVLKRGVSARKSSTNSIADDFAQADDLSDVEHAAETLLESRTRKVTRRNQKSKVVQAAGDGDKTASAFHDFLASASAAGAGAGGSKAPAKASQPAASIPVPPAEISRPGDGNESYELPPLSILKENTSFSVSYADDSDLAGTAQKLQGTLREFGLSSRVEGWIAGPSVTTFKISMGEGERVSKIVNLEDDIALSLAAKSVRIFAPIPGTSLVGIEIPNDKPQAVYLSDVLPYATGGPLECAFGRDSEGKPIVVDLAGLPHLLVAGTTGSGKSVLLNAIVMSMLMRATPEQVRLIMVDPKRVEFTGYAGLPHLYVPVVTEPRQAASALQWGVTEMERRLKVFEHYKVRDIKTYNGNVDGDKYVSMENPPKHMPYFVIVIDELADLMMVAGKDVESSIVRIAQLGRAAGIHLIVATQRPSADVVTGLIRANIDNRVALSVDNSLNSRIILDQKGAEQLLGKGDMLVKLRGKKPNRAQGCWVSDAEIEETVKFIKEQVTADYHEDILTAVVPNAPGAAGAVEAPKDDDPLVWEAAKIIVDSQLGSTSSLQRALSVGYARAGRIMDMLEAKGVVGPANGSKPREVLLDKEGLEDLKLADAQYREV
ncbi:DNA translocase FtsK [Paratractidigestivibacter sp.]|uniref:FtsK/SpoIIIE family DNA translocase n=1 Tax=Paratractidigestivibacter sp. TaxID=2847316 RepID=UPI002AC90889|nr:DNA translocase FtsK [Paratractidigestivibacter sp.]